MGRAYVTGVFPLSLRKYTILFSNLGSTLPTRLFASLLLLCDVLPVLLQMPHIGCGRRRTTPMQRASSIPSYQGVQAQTSVLSELTQATSRNRHLNQLVRQ